MIWFTLFCNIKFFFSPQKSKNGASARKIMHKQFIMKSPAYPHIFTHLRAKTPQIVLPGATSLATSYYFYCKVVKTVWKAVKTFFFLNKLNPL